MSRAKRIAAVLWISVVLVLMVAGGCGPRVHIHPDHGRSLKRHFLMQRIFPEAAEGNLAGLDSEEAAMIHSSYRKQFGGSVRPEESSRVLVLQEGKGGKKKQ